MPKRMSYSRRFRKRRGLNWLILGLTYSSLYMGRYNLPLVNLLLSNEYGWDKMQMGEIISPALFVYGLFAMFNGPIADRIGGRKTMIIGTLGSAVVNILFGLGAYLGFLGRGNFLIAYFAAIWMINSYFQSFGAVSLIKVNSAWFHIAERGIFSAVFGSMIQLGRTLIFLIGPFLIMFLPWQWLFFIPAIIILVMSFLTYKLVKNGPEDCGLPKLDVGDGSHGDPKPLGLKKIIVKIFANPVTISIAMAEFCTGFVRQGFEQWFPRYMVEVQKLPLESPVFQRNAIAIVVAGIVGAVLAGTLSDWVFGGRRMPVAALGYSIQIVCLTLVWRAPSLNWVILAFILNSCAISMVQSMLSGTASMDFGGKKAAATAAGFFDGMQYIGGSFVGLGLGWMLDRFGWVCWGPSMIGFSGLGLVLMLVFWNSRPLTAKE